MPLLDEQFLLAWARDPHAFGSNFYAFAGLIPGDHWGPLTPLSIQLAPIWHIHILFALAGLTALFFALREATRRKAIAIPAVIVVAAVLILLEPFTWLGSRGLWLGFALTSLALYFFVRSRFTLQKAMTNVTIAICIYALALTADMTVFVATPVFLLLEYFLYRRNKAAHRYDSTFSLLAPLVPVVLCGCALSAVDFRYNLLDFTRVKLKSEYVQFANSVNSQSGVVAAPAQIAPSPLFTTNGHILFDPVTHTVAANRIATTAPPNLVHPKISLHVQDPNARGVSAPCFGFPTKPEYGLYVIPFASNQLQFDVDNTPGSTGILFEFSLPGMDFEIPNGTKLSGVTLKTVPLTMNPKDGNTVTVPIDNISEHGIYAVRAVSLDKGHNMIGHFSDTLYLLIQRPTQFGWSTQ